MARRNQREIRRPEDWFPPVRIVPEIAEVHGLGTVDNTLGTTTFLVLVDATSVDKVVNLPAASASTNRIISVKKTDSSAHTVTVDASGAETIDGATTIVLTEQWESITIVCNGTAWFIINRLQSSLLLG